MGIIGLYIGVLTISAIVINIMIFINHSSIMMDSVTRFNIYVHNEELDVKKRSGYILHMKSYRNGNIEYVKPPRYY